MNNYFFGNAYNPTPEEKLEMLQMCEKYKKSCWLPESVAVIGDSYLFYNDVEDLKEKWYYEYVKKNENNPGWHHLGHSLGNLSLKELNKKWFEYSERKMIIEANYILNYVKKVYGKNVIEED